MRKFAFFLICLVLITILRATQLIPPEGYESMFWGIVIGFGGGNVGEHFAKRTPNV